MADLTLFQATRVIGSNGETFTSPDAVWTPTGYGSQTATKFEGLYNGVVRERYEGNDFKYYDSGFFASGTITSISTFSSNGKIGAQYTNLNDDVLTRNRYLYLDRSGYTNYQYSLRGNDKIVGSTANDLLWGSQGNDTINGGAGIDVLSFNKFYTSVNLNLATGRAITSYGTSVISNIEDIEGSGYNDTLTGNSGNNQIQGFGGDDKIDGGAGVDTVVYFDATSGVAVNLGTGYAMGGSGNDVISNVENITGSSFGDYLIGNSQANVLNGGDGHDNLDGDSGNDRLIGGKGNDSLDGGTGNDTLVGGLGDDIYTVDAVGDVVIETSTLATEIDTIKSSVNNTLVLNVEKLVLTGTGNINGTGNALNNTITGNSGSNILNGGAGKDTLRGGAGKDTFVFQFGQSLISGVDRITDFTIGTDKIDLRTQTGLATNAPTSFTRASNSTATNLTTLRDRVFTDANGATAGNQALGTNSAAVVQVTSGGIAGTYLAINDGIAGFQANSDLLINITGYTGTLPGLGSIGVNSVFA